MAFIRAILAYSDRSADLTHRLDGLYESRVAMVWLYTLLRLTA